MSDDRIARLGPLVGTWDVTMSGAPWLDEPVSGRASFEWILGGRFVLQRGTTEIPEAPDVYAVIGADPRNDDGYVQHYFDSREVTRTYAMSFDGTSWVLTRDRPDYSAFEFSQRWTAELRDGGNTIAGTWWMAKDHRSVMSRRPRLPRHSSAVPRQSPRPTDIYEKDFDLTYTRVTQ